MARLVVGLGNPGNEYENTRHNVGFYVVDLLGDNLRASYWKEEAGALTSAVRLGEIEIVLAKPQTFMNLSGKAIAKLIDRYETSPAEMIVIHDDLDLGVGSVRVKRDGGHGGHNGLRSVTEQLGTNEYARVRIGIGRPPGRKDAADYVLEPMRSAVREEIEAVVPTAAQAVVHILEHGITSAMQEFNAT